MAKKKKKTAKRSGHVPLKILKARFERLRNIIARRS